MPAERYGILSVDIGGFTIQGYSKRSGIPINADKNGNVAVQLVQLLDAPCEVLETCVCRYEFLGVRVFGFHFMGPFIVVSYSLE